MRFISKLPSPDFFEEEISVLDANETWSAFQNPCKTQLKKYILSEEQAGLCVYCERELDVDSSRLEHLKPRSLFPNLLFSYDNLTVSCRGREHSFNQLDNSFDGYNVDSCDHFKDSNYDEQLFIDPTKEEDLASKFIFDKGNGAISENNSDLRSRYMIDTLNLDNPSLRLERLNAKTALWKVLGKKNINVRRGLLNRLLEKNHREFITFLRYCFPH